MKWWSKGLLGKVISSFSEWIRHAFLEPFCYQEIKDLCTWYRNVSGTEMSLVPKCPWYRNVPVPKCLWGRNVLVPKCLWDRNVPVPKCPWYRNVPVPKCLWGRNVLGPKCPWYRNVPVPKCLWDRNVRTEMSHAEKSGTEMWNSRLNTIQSTMPGTLRNGKKPRGIQKNPKKPNKPYRSKNI